MSFIFLESYSSHLGVNLNDLGVVLRHTFKGRNLKVIPLSELWHNNYEYIEHMESIIMYFLKVLEDCKQTNKYIF